MPPPQRRDSVVTLIAGSLPERHRRHPDAPQTPPPRGDHRRQEEEYRNRSDDGGDGPGDEERRRAVGHDEALAQRVLREVAERPRPRRSACTRCRSARGHEPWRLPSRRRRGLYPARDAAQERRQRRKEEEDQGDDDKERRDGPLEEDEDRAVGHDEALAEPFLGHVAEDERDDQ